MGSRSLLRLGFGVVVLLVAGVTAGSIWLRTGPLPDPPMTLEELAARRAAAAAAYVPKNKFVIQAYGVGRDGHEFCDQVYERRNGTRVARRVEFFLSADRAKLAMRSEARTSELVDHESACGAAHDRARERSVLRVTAPSDAHFSVTWRDGKQVWSILSTSLDDALDFEREYFECEPSSDAPKPTPRPSAG